MAGHRDVVLERDELNTSVEIDPNKLTLNEAGNALGFEKSGGFEEMTISRLKWRVTWATEGVLWLVIF